VKTYGKVLLLLVLCAFCSCAGPGAETYKYAERAIGVSLKADPKLNLYQGSPHTLVVCLYQLSDPNAFKQLADEKGGVQKLYECSRFDPSVAYVKRVVVQPGQEIQEIVDRAEGARYMGVAAGYYAFRERPVRIYPIPPKIRRPIKIKKIPKVEVGKKPTYEDVYNTAEANIDTVAAARETMSGGWIISLYLGPQALQDDTERKDMQGK
jgi:type VI secretion system VasD/TssJ family lipoprotein